MPIAQLNPKKRNQIKKQKPVNGFFSSPNQTKNGERRQREEWNIIRV
jgi:hypothetical protein